MTISELSFQLPASLWSYCELGPRENTAKMKKTLTTSQRKEASAALRRNGYTHIGRGAWER